MTTIKLGRYGRRVDLDATSTTLQEIRQRRWPAMVGYSEQSKPVRVPAGATELTEPAVETARASRVWLILWSWFWEAVSKAGTSRAAGVARRAVGGMRIPRQPPV